MQRFEFATAQRIVFGCGAVAEAGALAKPLGRRCLLLTGRTGARAAGLRAALDREGLAPEVFAVPGEPSTGLVSAALARGRAAGCDVVIGCGGGSVLDAAKAVAALLANGGEILDYLEVVGRGLPLVRPSVPFVAIPTTAGTGTEVTRNAVLTVPECRVKASLRGSGMLPHVALVDPELTLTLPPAVTAATGMDALTQLLEPFVSPRASPMTDCFCREGLRLVGQSLRRAWENGADLARRTEMSLASLLGGLALSNAGLGAVHGLAAPIGGACEAPHGAVCAALLSRVMEANVCALRARLPGSPALGRYAEAARLLTGRSAATADEGVAWVEDLRQALEIPPLRAYGLAADAVADVVAKAARANSMKSNPIGLTAPELTEVLMGAL
jgi:alcohol dehydrogenase class IV